MAPSCQRVREDVADVIEIEELHKAYGSLPVLQGVSLRVAAGEVYGLLGPNGAGKTTLIHLSDAG
ncbi:MAG: ATP-binding cassette domain-containing protein, partial [Chloroflexaceae bacterium]